MLTARDTVESPRLQSTQGLIDVAMIGNLLTVTIVGGYDNRLAHEPRRPATTLGRIDAALGVVDCACPPAKIEMTAPETQAAANGGYVVQFTMPGEYRLETLPEPLDRRVKLKEVSGGRFAVIRLRIRRSAAESQCPSRGE